MSDSQSLLQQAIASAKAGRRDVARRMFQQVVAQEPENQVAWLYLAGLATSADEANQALARVQHLNPDSPHLARARTWATRRFEPAARASSVQADTVPVPAGPWPAAPPAEPPAPPERARQVTPYRLWERLVLAFTAATLVIVLGVTLIALMLPPESAAQLVPAEAQAAIPLLRLPTPTDTPAQAVARLVPELEAARAAMDYPSITIVLERMHAADPGNESVTAQLREAYLAQGMIQRNAGDYHNARLSFERALAVDPTSEVARREAGLSALFQTGAELHQQGQWADALSALQQVYERDPGYPHIDELLYSVHYNLGLAREAANALEEALASFEAANAILPEAPEAGQKIEEITLKLTPPTPTPTPVVTPPPTPEPKPGPSDKRVVVDISEQRAYLYEKDELVRKFVVSTGEPGRDTAIGEFEILNKIPLAYASTWNLDMPYWLGIYWAGPLQNGFHALPTVRHTGLTMWDGYLGQRVSYGCIILSNEDAKTLYDWVDIGTPVSIQP